MDANVASPNVVAVSSSRLWLISLLLASLFGCGSFFARSDDMVSVPADMASPLPENGGERGNQGTLPPGFYRLQCQWDACEPAPSSANPAIRPPQ